MEHNFNYRVYIDMKTILHDQQDLVLSIDVLSATWEILIRVITQKVSILGDTVSLENILAAFESHRG